MEFNVGDRTRDESGAVGTVIERDDGTNLFPGAIAVKYDEGQNVLYTSNIGTASFDALYYPNEIEKIDE